MALLPSFTAATLVLIFKILFLASQDAQEVMLVTLPVTLADLSDVTLVSEDAAHNSLQMSSSRDLTDVSEDAAHNSLQTSSSRDLTDVSEDAAHNSLQMSSSRDTTDVSEDAAHNSCTF